MELAALGALDAAAHEPVPVGRLSATLGLSSAATTELVDRLERSGLVRRERHPDDRRQVLVVLKPAARRVGEQLLRPWGARIHDAATALSESERRAVARYLGRLLGDR